MFSVLTDQKVLEMQKRNKKEVETRKKNSEFPCEMIIEDTHAAGRCLRVGRAEKVLSRSDRNLQCTKHLVVFVMCFLLFLISCFRENHCIFELPLHAAHCKPSR